MLARAMLETINLHRRNLLRGTLAAALPGSTPAPAAGGALAEVWGRDALALIVKHQLNPLRAARVLAYLHVAVHDAYVQAQPAWSGLQTQSPPACAHLAAGEVLAFFFPQETPGRIEAQAWQRAGLTGGSTDPVWLPARTLANTVAAQTIARARSDGAGRIGDARGRPPLRPGVWQASPPINAQRPVESLAGEWRTWGGPLTGATGGELAGSVPPPHAVESAAYRAELAEVLAVTRALTAAQRASAERWNLEQGSVTPGGVWLGIALEEIRVAALDEAAALRLLSTLCMAMMDAMVRCWRVKYTYWTERPITAIRRELDPGFTSHLITPAFPGYVSGHASLSGAASAVLSHFLPARAAVFSGQAEEAALSRLYGGIHFRSDNDAGLELGRAVGAQLLKPV